MSKTAIITGGAGGMGLETARILSQDHSLIITDISADRLEQASRELDLCANPVDTMVADVADEDAVEAVFATAASVGPVVAVVHTAGVSPRMGDAEMILRTNVLGSIHVTEAALATASPGSALVLVASLAGHLAPEHLVQRDSYGLAHSDPESLLAIMSKGLSDLPATKASDLAYSLSKNFVIWYAADQARRFGVHDSRILSVSPGTFDTSMGRLEEQSGSATILEFAALKRFGQPQEIAELLAFCAGSKAGYLTGTDVLCDGGTLAAFDLAAMGRSASIPATQATVAATISSHHSL